MKVIVMAVILLTAGIQGFGQVDSEQKPQRPINWALLNATVLDMASDWLEDLSLQADVVDKKDEIYSPREADSGRLESKLRRIATTPADQQVIGSLSFYYFKVNSCRIMSAPDSPMERPAECSFTVLTDLKHQAEDRLEEIKKLHASALRRKPASPVAK